MSAPTDALAADQTRHATIRVAATADIHCDDHNREAVENAFSAIDGSVDLILLAGDLTTNGEPEQAVVLADSCRGLATPVVAVLGNHDHHAGRRDELVSVLVDAGIDVLDRGHVTYTIGDCQVGIAGTKGFVGGFRGLGLPDFGEPSLRAIYAETTAEVDALARGLGEIALCPFRIALLHYAPTPETLHGEPSEIWTFLGSERLAAPILEHRPDLVLHGHAHSGVFQASLEGVPVHNVSVAVTGRDFWVFELTSAERAPGPIH
jgi:Icc-related predicted phosphoesterase